MTLGQLRLRLQQQYAGTNLELITGWIQNRHRQIIDKLPWQRGHARQILTIQAQYTTGTIALTTGSDVVTGTSTAWTSLLDKRVLRIPGSNERYEFRYVSATSATLDRVYAGATGTALTYSLVKPVYSLPTDLMVLKSASLQHPALPLEVCDVARIDEMDPSRIVAGQPQFAAVYMDTQTDPPFHQVEFWPWPTAAYSLDYSYEVEEVAPETTPTRFLPWIRADCIEAGVAADILRFQKDWQGGREMEAVFQARLAEMCQSECFRRVPAPMRKADWITRRNVDAVVDRRGWRW